MTNEELKEYKENLKIFQESAQWEYRNTHKSCKFCEHTFTENEWSNCIYCKITKKLINSPIESDLKAWLRPRFCKYYIAKTDLS